MGWVGLVGMALATKLKQWLSVVWSHTRASPVSVLWDELVCGVWSELVTALVLEVDLVDLVLEEVLVVLRFVLREVDDGMLSLGTNYCFTNAALARQYSISHPE